MTRIKTTKEEIIEMKRLFHSGEDASSIALKLNRATSFVHKKLNENGLYYERKRIGPKLPTRNRTNFLTDEQINELRELRESGWTQQAIADKFGVSKQLIVKYININNIKGTCASGEFHIHWKGGHRAAPNGYRYVTVDIDSPYRSMRNASGAVLAHRLVMAEYLGRCLIAKETVHHINGDRADNRIENLQLRIGKHGKHERWQCADCGSHNIEAVAI